MDLKIHNGYADTALGQVHYREAGSGPTVLLFHESPLSGRVFEAALPVLGRRVRAIAVDTPGYGTSTPPPEPLPISGYAQRMALLMDALGLDKTAAVGTHTGGAIAAQLAVDNSERVPALVVVGCPLFNDEERRQRLESYLEPFELSQDGKHLHWVWDHYRQIWADDSSLELLHMASTEFLRVGPRYTWAYQAAFRFEADVILPMVKCPTLYLVTEGDGLRGKNERAVELTPNSRGKVIDSPYGQFAARDPEGFSREVLGFLDRVGYLDRGTG